MKRFLFFLLTALMICGQWSTVSARYNLVQRKAYNEIKVGDTIAIQGISDNANNGYRFIAGAQLQTAFTEDCVFTVEEGPADIRTGDPTYFLHNLVADKYFGKNGLRGTSPSGWNDTRLVSTPDSAYNFMLACAADSTQEWNGQHNFDEGSTVFIYSYNNGSEDKFVNMCNWGYYEPEKIYMWGYKDTSPWDVYSVTYEKDLRGDLADLVDYYSSLNLEFPAGSDPGFYPTELAEAFITAMDEATVASMTEHTDAEYQQYIDNLKAAKEAVEAAYIDITDGYYFVVSAYTEFLNKQKVEKGAYVNNNSTYIQWADFDPTNPDYVFRIEKLASGNYSVQSFSNDKYWNAPGSDSNSQGITTSSSLTNEQIFNNIGAGQWQIWNTFSKKHYHPESNGAGSGKNGKFVTWNSSGVGSSSTWYVRKADDQLVDSLVAVREQNRLTEQLSKVYGEAFNTYSKLFVYKPDTEHPLITNVTDGDPDDCQLSSNASDSSEGGHLSYLKDNNPETFWHSSYHDASDPKPLTYHYLQADISNSPQTEFQIYFMRRSGSYGQSDRPVEVNVYATADTTGQWNHTDQWTLVEHFASLPTDESITEYYTPALHTSFPASYIRFEVVKNNSSSRQHNGYSYFNLAEFNIYTTTLDEETSQYLYSDEIKAAADALKALMDPALDKISSNTATQDDIDQLRQAIKVVDELYADTTTLKNLITAAERNLQGATVGDKIGQISSQDAIDALVSAINSGKAFDTSGKIDKEALDALCNTLKQARTDFLHSINMPAEDKWYYIASLDTTRNDNESLYTNGALMYVADYGRDKGVVWALNEGEAYDYNPFAMWHFIPVEDEDYTLTYYVQNLGSGLYIGDYPTYSQPVLTTDQPVLYQFNYTGGELGLIARKGENPGYSLHAANKDNAIVGWSAGAGTPSSWAFNEVDTDIIDAITITAKTNNIDVFAVPYDFADLQLYNGEDVHTYAIRKMTLDPETDITTIEFYEKDAFAAGEPCVLVIGDPTQEEGDEMTLVIATPTEIATDPVPANGIVGLWATDPVPANTAWFTGKEITISDQPVHISAHTGYIDATLYTGEVTGVETALTLEIEGLNWPAQGDKPADVNGDGKVNTADVVAVYTFIEKGSESGFVRETCDVNKDDAVNTADVVAIYTAIIGGEASGSPRWIRRILTND